LVTSDTVAGPAGLGGQRTALARQYFPAAAKTARRLRSATPAPAQKSLFSRYLSCGLNLAPPFSRRGVLTVGADSTKEGTTSTIGASSSNDSPAQVDALPRLEQQSGTARHDVGSPSLAPASLQRTNAAANAARYVLLVVLPSSLCPPERDATKKTYRTYLAFPYGVLTIASYLKRFAAALSQVEILDLNLPGDDTPEALLARKLAAMNPDIVGFSMSYDVSYPWLKSMAAAVRRHDPNICIVAGGAAITTAYAEVITGCEIDACCYSEGEVAFKELVDADDMAEALTRDPWVTKTKSLAVPVYDDLDRIIDVDYSLVNVPAYSMREAFSPFTKFTSSSKQFFIVTSRGCPFKCVFCAEPSFHGANMRYVSVDRAIEHVTSLKDRYGLSVLTIYDDQILMNKPRAKEFFAKLAPLDIRVEMPNGVTLSYIDDEMAALMKAAGVDTLYLAIEHGSKRVLKDIIHKPIAYNRIKPTIALLQAAGIYCQGFFVIGLPGETRAEREETRDAILDWGLDWASFNYATPLRGSELFRQCKANGWIDEKYLPIGAIDMTKYVIRAPGMDPAEIDNFVFNVNLDVNFVHNRNMRIGNFAVASRTFKELVERHPGQAFAHYFLARCDDLLAGDGSASYRRYEQIVAKSQVWREAAERFGLEIEHDDTASRASRRRPSSQRC
jgi:anaerobic magnesium-protoporphyrin IX monomethyl ester cyclase